MFGGVSLKKRKDKKEIRYSKKKAGVILSVVSVVMCILTVIGIIAINQLNAKLDLEDDQNVLRMWIDEHPVISAVIMVLICSVQVIVAFIPGEVVELAAGYAFGAWWGAVLCLVGITIGSVIAMLIAKKLGRRVVEAFYPPEKLDSLPILNDKKKRNAFVALLFLIPGTPKDLITYIVGLTSMSIPTYVLLTTACRFPSIIMSTLSGDAAGENKWEKALWILVISGVICGVGYIAYLFIRRRTSKKKDENGAGDNLQK